MNQRQRRTKFSIYNFLCHEPQDSNSIQDNLAVHIALPHNGVAQAPLNTNSTSKSAPSKFVLLRPSAKTLSLQSKKNNHRTASFVECQEAYGNTKEPVRRGYKLNSV